MKFIAASDLHVTNKKPLNRADKSYLYTCLNKLEQILKITTKTDSKLLVIGGDFFDSAMTTFEVVYYIIEIIKQYNVTIFVVPGQHDLRYHKSGLTNTPLGVLSASKDVYILSNIVPVTHMGVSFIGSGWNEEPKKQADVLVTHRMVIRTEDKKLWNKQEEFETTSQLMKKYKWAKCIISGDNHEPFKAYKPKLKRCHVNCGSIMRSTKAQLHHKPCVWEIDSKIWKPTKLLLKIAAPEIAFDFDKIALEMIKTENREKAEKDIEKFIDTLTEGTQEKPNFTTVLQSVIKKIKPNKATINLINEIMEEVS